MLNACLRRPKSFRINEAKNPRPEESLNSVGLNPATCTRKFLLEQIDRHDVRAGGADAADREALDKSDLKPQVRIYVILARDANRGVVFRRGPSKQVQLLVWHTDTDKFEDGQWFKGRIYERRCDLSPSGKLLIYFAAKHKLPYFSWTAVSKPPFLTALAMWPKGDCWGGGGLFEKERKIRLNHGPHQMALADGFAVPSRVSVAQIGRHSGGGEDEPIMSMRLTRDGWKLLQTSEATIHNLSDSVWMEFNPAHVWAKKHGPSRGRYELQMHILGLHERDGPWYLIDHVVVDKKNGSTIQLERTEWADWCHSGDLLFARKGRLFRLGFSSEGVLNDLTAAKLVIDLNDRAFTEIAAPAEAKQWF